MTYDPDSLFHALAGCTRSSLPPVHQWNPSCVQEVDMRIARDGTWHYQGTPINRQRMVRMFSTVLRKDDDGYYLVTPVEKVRVEVELAPFIAVKMETVLEPDGPAVAFQTNVDDITVVDRAHPLWVEHEDKGPVPMVRVRDRLDALLTRSVFYELALSGETRLIGGREILGVESRGDFFALGPVDE